MKISILVPIYNVEKYIEDCVKSLFMQTYTDLEYIFVNDKTSDSSISVLNRVLDAFPNRKSQTKIINHLTNKGLAAARLTGLANSTGDYIMFVDSDDFLELNAVEIMYNKIIQEGSDVVIPPFNHLFKNKVISDKIIEYNKYDYLRMLLRREIGLNVAGRLFKRTLFFNYGISFVEGINMGEDYLVSSRLFYYVQNISYVHKPLYNYLHINSNSYTTSFKKTAMDEVLRASEIIGNFYHTIGDQELIRNHRIGNLKLKAELLILLLRSNNSNKQDYLFISNLFSQYPDLCSLLSNLSLQDRMIVKASNYLPENVMRKIVKTGYSLKQFIK